MNHNSTSGHPPTENPMPFATSPWMSPRPAEARLTDEADRFALSRFNAATDEVVVVDERSETSPAQAVEDRLISLLREASLPVSHLQLRGKMLRGRRDD